MSDVVIKLRENGPILITGPVTLTDHLGNKFDTSGQANIALCRCGHSQKKPFCDGSHKTSGFVGSEPPSSGSVTAGS
jgi:CDGSH-type Zn-finger protein